MSGTSRPARHGASRNVTRQHVRTLPRFREEEKTCAHSPNSMRSIDPILLWFSSKNIFFCGLSLLYVVIHTIFVHEGLLTEYLI